MFHASFIPSYRPSLHLRVGLTFVLTKKMRLTAERRVRSGLNNSNRKLETKAQLFYKIVQAELPENTDPEPRDYYDDTSMGLKLCRHANRFVQRFIPGYTSILLSFTAVAGSAAGLWICAVYFSFTSFSAHSQRSLHHCFQTEVTLGHVLTFMAMGFRTHEWELQSETTDQHTMNQRKQADRKGRYVLDAKSRAVEAQFPIISK
jgi:hypothetical protein